MFQLRWCAALAATSCVIVSSMCAWEGGAQQNANPSPIASMLPMHSACTEGRLLYFLSLKVYNKVLQG